MKVSKCLVKKSGLCPPHMHLATCIDSLIYSNERLVPGCQRYSGVLGSSLGSYRSTSHLSLSLCVPWEAGLCPLGSGLRWQIRGTNKRPESEGRERWSIYCPVPSLWGYGVWISQNIVAASPPSPDSSLGVKETALFPWPSGFIWKWLPADTCAGCCTILVSLLRLCLHCS